MLPIRSIVLSKSNPWNMLVVEVRPRFSSRSISGWWWRRYSPAAIRKPAVPQAGSQMTSAGVGATISTMSWMMWRGVRN